MNVIEKELDISPTYDFASAGIKNPVFFDIETTGFSPTNTILYLIGCIYQKESSYHMIQWFSDGLADEPFMLRAFFSFIEPYNYLIHYNGLGFDLPYLRGKCERHRLMYPLDRLKHIDLYKKILPYKSIFKLENLKQKSIEHFLGFQRDDIYNGAELISLYHEYRQTNEHARKMELSRTLRLHNGDDIKGLADISQILVYADLFEKGIHLLSAAIEGEELILTFEPSSPLPKRVSYGNQTIYFIGFGSVCTLRIAIYRQELKYFYKNYKEYYYLPNEDTAIHQSVAFYVDKNFRTKAKAANCYSKKTGCFVPQYKELISPFFKIDYFDKITYVEVTNEFLEQNENLCRYANSILLSLITK